ncbi:hypothetical protein [Nocardioides sp. ChNu-99]|uniref:hypothetical protein n=1 Tax=Nocardioides sp. ChNu-99 TaxID=2839897 RepID=UPI0024064A1E|nr:hypothetical protein [Nocardioides sp. ChNu-99]MDF9717243.1 hypothetical protein [Nocardioides sp. ChNu-99]
MSRRPPRRRGWPVRADEFDLPDLPEPYLIRYYPHSPARSPDTVFRYRLELCERRKLLGVVPWPRMLLREEFSGWQVSDSGKRRWAVATFLQRVVAEGYVDADALPARMLRKK